MSLTLTGHCLHQTDTLANSGLGMIYLDHKAFYSNKLPSFKNPVILPPNPDFQLFLKKQYCTCILYSNYQLMLIAALFKAYTPVLRIHSYTYIHTYIMYTCYGSLLKCICYFGSQSRKCEGHCFGLTLSHAFTQS